MRQCRRSSMKSLTLSTSPCLRRRGRRGSQISPERIIGHTVFEVPQTRDQERTAAQKMEILSASGYGRKCEVSAVQSIMCITEMSQQVPQVRTQACTKGQVVDFTSATTHLENRGNDSACDDSWSRLKIAVPQIIAKISGRGQCLRV